MHRTKRCDGVSRRDVVRIGGLSALGLGLGDFFGLRNAHAAALPEAKAKSCILIWLNGGPSHLESFDPKPEAPEEVRGPLESIATNLPGIRVGECLERTAKMMDKLTVIRSMTSPLGEHVLGTHYVMTGYKPSQALEYPTFGATVAHSHQQSHLQREGEASFLPPNIAIPSFSASQGLSGVSGNGFLPTAAAPFSLNPAARNFKVRDLDFYSGLDLKRTSRRREIANAFDDFGRQMDAAASHSDPNLERAYNLITSSEAKRAFKLSEEPDSVRQRYGGVGRVTIGQSCLLARRLVERGVPFVTVVNDGWDTHENIHHLKQRNTDDRDAHLPSLDRALSALVEDLSDRDMLDETLIIAMGEFGRTPKINQNAGRDHWPLVFSAVLAGGGVPGGQVVGSSDALGELPKDNPITPSDLSASIYTLLGIDPAHELHTSDGRPVRVAPDGARVIPELVG
ncbi:MAG: DUF1501 domain-containing protein [Planctomycetaceae bacterium]